MSESKEESANERQHLSPKKKHQRPATRQMKLRRRYPPRAPGGVSVPVGIVITMCIQFALVITNFFVIFSSLAYDGDGIGWIIFVEIVFTYVGFAYFVRQISHQILVHKRFFQSLNAWYDRKLQSIQNGDGSCCCLWLILLQLAWWIAALFMFPGIICWAMLQCYKWSKDRRRNAESELDPTQMENVTGSTADARQYWKMTDHAYSVWHLGVLSKQASMVVMFIQDIPLLIIAAFITNYLGIIVYSISIVLKLLMWCKHMYDLGTFTVFYKPEHYLDHFGIKSITWDNEFGCAIIVATFYDAYEQELSTLQVADWVGVYDEKRDEWDVMIVWKNRHFKKTDNLVLVDWDKVDQKAMDDFDNGLAKKVMVDPEAIHHVNRWDGNVILLRDEDFIKYHDHRGENESTNNANNVTEVDIDGNEAEKNTNNTNDVTEVEHGDAASKEDPKGDDVKDNGDNQVTMAVVSDNEGELSEENKLIESAVDEENDNGQSTGYEAVPLNDEDV